MVLSGLSPGAISRAEPSAGELIDDCRYPTDAVAAAAWQPMAGTAKAQAAAVAGDWAVRLSCNFAGTKIERASWDRKVKINLATRRKASSSSTTGSRRAGNCCRCWEWG